MIYNREFENASLFIKSYLLPGELIFKKMKINSDNFLFIDILLTQNYRQGNAYIDEFDMMSEWQIGKVTTLSS